MKWRALLMKVVAVVIVLAIAYAWLALTWSYSTGERAGYLQKFSRKGFICKTWEGEIALISLPSNTPEIFHFTVRDEKVATAVTDAMSKRVSLHYEQHIGVPSSCFGETEYFVTGVKVVEGLITIPPQPGEAISQPR